MFFWFHFYRLRYLLGLNRVQCLQTVVKVGLIKEVGKLYVPFFPFLFPFAPLPRGLSGGARP